MKTALFLAGLGAIVLLATDPALFSILKNNVWLGKQSADLYLVPTNQLLHPWGRQVMLRGRPVDFAFDSARNLLAVLNSNGVSTWEALTEVQTGEARSR